MTENEKSKCHLIIHSAAAASGAGNIVPIPGLGAGADMAAITTMAISLASVFGRELTSAAARGAAYAALKRAILKQPAKYLAKEFVKIIPFLGQAVAAGISVALAEAAGWQLAYEFDSDRQWHQTMA